MPSRGLLHIFTDDVQTKLLALGSAILLWGLVTILGSRTITIQNVPVALVNLPPDVGVGAGLMPVTVLARVPRTVQLSSDPTTLVRAFVDMAGSGLGERVALVTVTPTDQRIDVLGVTPASLRLILDPIVERNLPVRVIPDGTPADGYQVGDVSAIPDRVRVRAPLGMFQNLSAVEAHVAVGGVTEAIDGEVPIANPDGVHATPDRVRVRVAIEQAETTKTVGIRVPVAGTPAAGYWVRTITTTPATVTIQGPRERLEPLVTVNTAPVNIDGAQQAVENRVSLALPEGVRLVGSDANVNVRVDIGLLDGTKELSANITVTDVSDGLRVADISPERLRVTVRGPAAALSDLREENIRIVLSASGRGGGSFTSTPTVDAARAPAGVQVVSVERREVRITLEGS